MAYTNGSSAIDWKTVNIEVIHSLAGLETLAPEWRALHRQCPRATPFQSPEWLIPWTRHMFRGGEIQALAIRDTGVLTGFAPLFCWGVDRRVVSFLGAGISDYGDLLFAPDREPECVAAVSDFLTSRKDHWDALDLQEIRAGSALLTGQSVEVSSVCPVLDLATYPDTMDRKHRTDVRRAQNKLRKAEINFAANTEEFHRLYQARWGEIDPSLRQLHQEAAANFFAAALLRLGILRLDGNPAAAIFAFTTGSTLYCYLSAFDPAMAKISPGAVLLAWILDQAISEKIKEVDFLRQNEPYKYLWGARDRLNYRITGSALSYPPLSARIQGIQPG